MTKIFNATQHAPTPDQIAAGMGAFSPVIGTLITFEELPSSAQILLAAEGVVATLRHEGAKHGDTVMIGGAPFFMATLELCLLQAGLKPVFAFSRRDCVEVANPDGSVRKTYEFRHLGFVPSTLTGTEHDPFAHEEAWGLLD